jgi:ribosome-associated protein
LPHGAWVLMDYGDVVVHVFQDDARQLYDLDGLWLDARRLSVPGETATASATE